MNKLSLCSVLLLFTGALFGAPSIGEVADNLFGPVSALTRIMFAACYVLGMTLALFALLHLKAHRQNPKLIPLSLPFVIAICAAILMLIPKVTTLSGYSWAAPEQEKRGQQRDFVNYRPIPVEEELPQSEPLIPEPLDEEIPLKEEVSSPKFPEKTTAPSDIAEELAPELFEDPHDPKFLIEE